jgi:crotonobetainyl-CoA:carnitine CoA-transferase CaiB-like acyl-CoA transferase
MLLADLGAEVIKVETPGIGDYARMTPEEFGGLSVFEAVNRGKRGVAINYRRPRGRELLLRLAATCDIFIETFRPGAVAGWGLDYEAVRVAAPSIVYCSLSGYGQDGPYADRGGHDLNYLAIGGLLALNRAVGGPPIPPGVQIADMAGAMLAAVAVQAALVCKLRTGEGAYLDVSMLDAVLSWLAPMAGTLQAGWRKADQAPKEVAPLAGALPAYNVYAAADGKYLALSALEPHFWTAFCATAGCEELQGRRLDPSAIGEVAALFARRTRADWLALFAGVDACLEPVLDADEVATHPQVRHLGLVEPDGRFATPFRLVRDGSDPRQAPSVGEHTYAVLAELGLSKEEIARLAAEKVIAGPAPETP